MQIDAAGMAWSTTSRMVRQGTLERIAHGVYRIRGGIEVEHMALRAAWLQLAPSTLAWERTGADGVVSHRSAAALYRIGHLPADVHEFTLPRRRQTRREDVQVHRAELADDEWITLRGLPVTVPSRIAADMLTAREDPGAIGAVIADALRSVYDYPGSVAVAIRPHAAAQGLRAGDGLGLLRWLLELTGAPERDAWLREAGSTDPKSDGGPVRD